MDRCQNALDVSRGGAQSSYILHRKLPGLSDILTLGIYPMAHMHARTYAFSMDRSRSWITWSTSFINISARANSARKHFLKCSDPAGEGSDVCFTISIPANPPWSFILKVSFCQLVTTNSTRLWTVFPKEIRPYRMCWIRLGYCAVIPCGDARAGSASLLNCGYANRKQSQISQIRCKSFQQKKKTQHWT